MRAVLLEADPIRVESLAVRRNEDVDGIRLRQRMHFS
jgi:hypothetical protein